MNNPRYRKSAGCVSSLYYHIVWCPKYRRKVLTGQIAEALESVLRDKCAELDLGIRSLSIQPDHVHIFLSAPHNLPIPTLVNRLKGASAHSLRKRFASLRSRLPCMWSRSYYVGSVGNISAEAVERYIADQPRSEPRR